MMEGVKIILIRQVILVTVLLSTEIISAQQFQTVNFCRLIQEIKSCEKHNTNSNSFMLDKDSVVFLKQAVYKDGVLYKERDYHIYIFSERNNENFDFIYMDYNYKIHSLKSYVNNVISGWNHEFLNDSIEKKTFYKHGLRDGICYTKNTKTGIILELCNFTKDTLNGEYLEFYSNGSLKKSMQYFHGYPIGEYYEYYSNSELKIFGVIDGGYLCHFDIDTMKEQWYFNNNKINLEDVPNQIPHTKSNPPIFDFLYMKKSKWLIYQKKEVGCFHD